MPQPIAQNATATAADFLTRCFAPGESIALLLRREAPAATIQRIIQLETALAPRYLSWLAQENTAGANIYVAPNPLRSDSCRATKECIGSIRHLYLDLDIDGQNRFSSLRASDVVPPPNAVLSASLDKYQILWRVGGFTLERQRKRAETACRFLWWRSRLYRLQPRPPPVRIPELQVRSGASRHRQIPRRFHLEFR
jgi:hypothetical protein